MVALNVVITVAATVDIGEAPSGSEGRRQFCEILQQESPNNTSYTTTVYVLEPLYFQLYCESIYPTCLECPAAIYQICPKLLYGAYQLIIKTKFKNT